MSQNRLLEIFERITASKNYSETDVDTIRQVLANADEQTLLQLGKYNINIGDGKEIHIGNRTYVEWDEDTIQALIQALIRIEKENHLQSTNTYRTALTHGSPYVHLHPGAPFQAPPLPKHYVERPEHIEAVKAELLHNNNPGTLVIRAIYGMGGIGKSVLAAALAQENDIQKRFPDGILWVTLGQNPDILSMVNLWIRELGDREYNPTALKAASLHLRTLLAGKKALLVVDDVWHSEHVEPFRIGGAGCCVLITTRQTKIVGAARYNINFLTRQQSLRLLSQYLPTSLTAAERDQAETFAKEVGYLPLALELAAAQIEYGATWEELLQAFQEEMVELEFLDLDGDIDSISNEGLRKRRSLVASLKLTLKLLSPQQLKRFAWLGVLPEDALLTEQMATTLLDVKPFQAGKELRDFKNRALLLLQTQHKEDKPVYRTHDLIHALAKNLLVHEQYLNDLKGLGTTIQEAHHQFLERYRKQVEDGLWHTLQEDGYIHSHLTWHFEQANRSDLLHSLLQESNRYNRNGWYETCNRLGKTTTFITDISRAWRLAEKMYGDNKTESLILQFRYALITTSLNSLTQNIPSQLLVAFIQRSFWSPSQSLAYVRLIRDSSQRASNLAAIAQYMPVDLLEEVLVTVCTVEDEKDRAMLLKQVAPFMNEALADQISTLINAFTTEFNKVSVLIRLIPYISRATSIRILKLIRSLARLYPLSRIAK